MKSQIKSFILEKFLPGEDPEKLNDDTPLMTGGILDSLSTATLVEFLEDTFHVQFQAFEMSVDYLDTIDLIAETVQSKQG